MIFLIGLIYTQGVYITSYSNPTLHISKLRAKHGSVLRLIEQYNIPNYNDQDKWLINGTQVKIENAGDGSFICGKKNDPGVVPCTDQSYNIWYDIERDGEKAFFKTDNNMCLTMTVYDKNFKGYFINLKKCEKSNEQAFHMEIIKENNSSKENSSGDSANSNNNGGSASDSLTKDGNQSSNGLYQQNPNEYNDMALSGLAIASEAKTSAAPCSPTKKRKRSPC